MTLEQHAPRNSKGAMCVQRFDDSLNSAIHITYRISLRSSSMPEPRDPLLKVFNDWFITRTTLKTDLTGLLAGAPPEGGDARNPQSNNCKLTRGEEMGAKPQGNWFLSGNDPSAGSPTETLLRLLLPLNDQSLTNFPALNGRCRPFWASPKASLSHSIGSSDGRCVQRAGT